MKLTSGVMRGEIPRLYLLVAAVAVGSVSVDGLCERGRTWWHRQLGACQPCTRCDPRRLAVQYPCELHRDTICQSLYEIRLWPFHKQARKNNATNDSESSDYEYYEYVDYSDKVTESSDSFTEWTIQTSTLTIAASGCVIFFIVVVSLSLYHARQWKALKLALKSNVHDLSAKLKLMEAGGESPVEPVSADHHIYCNIHVGKNALHDPGVKGLGNVYTQEKHSS